MHLPFYSASPSLSVVSVVHTLCYFYNYPSQDPLSTQWKQQECWGSNACLCSCFVWGLSIHNSDLALNSTTSDAGSFSFNQGLWFSTGMMAGHQTQHLGSASPWHSTGLMVGRHTHCTRSDTWYKQGVHSSKLLL